MKQPENVEGGCNYEYIDKLVVDSPLGQGLPSMGIFFSGASDSSICPRIHSASKNEYQDIPGGKDGRYVRVTTLPPSCAECLEILEP